MTGEGRVRFGFWAAAFTFAAILAFSTAPSPLYVLYAERDHFSSLMITVIYAAYAVGVVASLFFVSHLSDIQGRRPHLISAVGLMVACGVLFIVWPSLPGLFIGRVASGVAVGLTVSTSTAYINELHQARHPGDLGGGAQLASTMANICGLSFGALISGLLAQYAPHPLVIPYLPLLAALAVAATGILLAPETRRRPDTPVPYRPQRVSVAGDDRPALIAALTGVLIAFAGTAIFIGLAGTFLTEVLHDSSLAVAGLTVFLVFMVGAVFVVAARAWPVRRMLVAGVVFEITGLGLVTLAAWLPRPSLAVFIIGGALVGAAASALFRATLGSVVAIAPVDRIGESLAAFYLAGYVGLAVPAVAVGLTLRYVDPRGTLLAFSIVECVGILACSRLLIGVRPPVPTAPPAPTAR